MHARNIIIFAHARIHLGYISMSRNRIPLSVIPKPPEGTRTVYDWDKPDPYIKGKGDTDYVCSICGHVLVEGVHEGQIRNMVFRCPNPKCRKYNEII